MTLQQIENKFTVYYPEGVNYFRTNADKFYKNWVMDVTTLEHLGLPFRNNLSAVLDRFIQVILLTTQNSYLDSFTICEDCFLFP
jgi:hypothetical protein